MRIKGLFLTSLPSFPSHAHVSFPHRNPGRSLSPCQPGLALVPRELCPWRPAPCISTKQRRPPAWGTTSPCTGKHAQGTFTAPVDSSAPGSDTRGLWEGEQLLAPVVLLTLPAPVQPVPRQSLQEQHVQHMGVLVTEPQPAHHLFGGKGQDQFQ